MRKLRTFTLYSSVILTYSFFTLPFLLPNNCYDASSTNFDVIIVLGGGVTTDCHLDASMQSRMDTAIQLFQLKKASKIILTGGPQDRRGRCLESEAMRQYALAQGIEETVLLKESLSLNTYQNAFNTVKIMEQKGMKSALIVTTDFHSKRANNIFARYDIDYQMVNASNKTSGLRLFKQLVKEQLILCFHAVVGVPNHFGLDIKEKKIAAVLKSLASS